jgi:hypothetical protein
MAEIYINRDDIKPIIQSYKNENDTFVIRSFVDKGSQQRCQFYLNGKDCIIDIFIKKNCVKIVPVGNNIDESNMLIDFISEKGFSTNVDATQFAFACTKDVVDLLVTYINDECVGLVNCVQEGSIYRFIGYNGDTVTFTFYSSTNNAMIQGKPFHAFSIVTTFLSSLPNFSFEDIISLNNTFAGMNTPASSIRADMQNRLEDAYSYLDEALLKSISGSLTLLKQKASSEDYTGCVTGEFKALEGYLKKILTFKYGYKLAKKDTFNMFHKDSITGKTELGQNTAIPVLCKKELLKLYSIYSNKRNVYLHSTVNPSQTRIISTLKEALSLSDEILYAIKDSYKVIFA